MSTERPMPQAQIYLGLGSNLGDRMASLLEALDRLKRRVEITTVSSVYETEPVGYLDQPKFLNAVCRGATTLEPLELLTFIKGIEKEMGRNPSFPNAPRIIDIDILFYDDLVLNTPELVIPHPRLAERAFVLVPLAEVAREMTHPQLSMTIATLARNVGGKEGIKLMGRLEHSRSPRP